MAVRKPKKLLLWDRKEMAHPKYGVVFAWVATSPNFGWKYVVMRNPNHRYECWIIGEWNTWREMESKERITPELPYYVDKVTSAPQGKEMMAALDKLFVIWYQNRQEPLPAP